MEIALIYNRALDLQLKDGLALALGPFNETD
jgi:hypothetical protein